MPAPEPLLHARRLSKTYGELVALAGVDLTIAAGTCLALLGPNGAGKTTLMEILAGLRPADDGDLQLWGSRLDPRQPHRRPRAVQDRLGVQVQENAYLDNLTLAELLDFFRSMYPGRALGSRQVLAQVGLADRAGSLYKQLSGGQKQRFSLAAALINQPELIFLDEPTTGLDPQSRRRIWELVAALKAEGRTILLSTHSMEEAEALGDRVVILDHGRIQAEGTVAELKARVPGQTVLRFRFADDRRPLSPVPVGLSGLGAAVWTAEGWLTVTADDLIAVVSSLLQHYQTQGCPVAQLEVRQTSLEDVFFALTGKELRD